LFLRHLRCGSFARPLRSGGGFVDARPAVHRPPGCQGVVGCGKLVGGHAEHGHFLLDTGRNRYRSDSMKLLRSVLKSPLPSFIFSTILIEWMTVEWCFPPKLRPISGSDAFVSILQRYIAI
jgi:hypothetical protein